MTTKQSHAKDASRFLRSWTKPNVTTNFFKRVTGMRPTALLKKDRASGRALWTWKSKWGSRNLTPSSVLRRRRNLGSMKLRLFQLRKANRQGQVLPQARSKDSSLNIGLQKASYLRLHFYWPNLWKASTSQRKEETGSRKNPRKKTLTLTSAPKSWLLQA